MTFLLAAFTAHEILIPASHPAQFGIGTAPEQRGTHHPDDFPQKLVLAVQASFDLGHEVFRQPQVIEGLLKGFSGLLRLVAITCKALLGRAAPALSRLGLSFMILSGAAGVLLPRVHGVLLFLLG